MDNTITIITNLQFPDYKKIQIECSNGKRYLSDLSKFSSVYCFPKDSEEWKKGFIDDYNLAVIWPCRFEVHIDQIMANATLIESTPKSA